MALVLGDEHAPEPALGEDGQRPLVGDGGLVDHAVLIELEVVELAVHVVDAGHHRGEGVELGRGEGQVAEPLGDRHLLALAATHVLRDVLLHLLLAHAVVAVGDDPLQGLAPGAQADVAVDGDLGGALDEHAEVRHEAEAREALLLDDAHELGDHGVGRGVRGVDLEADLDAVLLADGVDGLGQVRAESGGAQEPGAEPAGGHDVQADVGQDVLAAHRAAGDAAQVDVAAVGEDLDAVPAGGLEHRPDLLLARNGVLLEGLRADELDLGDALGGDVGEDGVDRPIVVLDELLGVAVAGDALLDAVDRCHGGGPQLSETVRVEAAEASNMP